MAATPPVFSGSPVPFQAQQDPAPSLLDKIRAVAAPLLVILGLAIFLSATISLGGHLFGYMAVPSDTVQMLFTASIMSIISGFHLSRDNGYSFEIANGPISFGTV